MKTFGRGCKAFPEEFGKRWMNYDKQQFLKLSYFAVYSKNV
jgi:hypothetical protein